MQKQFPRGVLQEEGVLQMCCEFLGAYPCTGVISIKSQSKFVEFALLQYNWGSRASSQSVSAAAFFKGIFQVVNSADLRDVKYIFKLDDVILGFSSMRLL